MLPSMGIHHGPCERSHSVCPLPGVGHLPGVRLPPQRSAKEEQLQQSLQLATWLFQATAKPPSSRVPQHVEAQFQLHQGLAGAQSRGKGLAAFSCEATANQPVGDTCCWS